MYYVFKKNDGNKPLTFKSKEELSLWLLQGKLPVEALYVVKGELISVEIEQKVIFEEEAPHTDEGCL